jgi:hypothetical protein
MVEGSPEKKQEILFEEERKPKSYVVMHLLIVMIRLA